MRNIRDMNKGQLRQHTQALWREEDRLLAPYDCGRALAEHIGPPRIREIRLELTAIEEECTHRNRNAKLCFDHNCERAHNRDATTWLCDLKTGAEGMPHQNRLETTKSRAYLARLAYNDEQERGAERCGKCGPTDPWFPRCNLHEPMP